MTSVTNLVDKMFKGLDMAYGSRVNYGTSEVANALWSNLMYNWEKVARSEAIEAAATVWAKHSGCLSRQCTVYCDLMNRLYGLDREWNAQQRDFEEKVNNRLALAGL